MAAKRGPLKTRLEPRRLPLLADEDAQLEVVRKWEDEDHQKLLLLCNEMGVPDGPQRFYLLSLALARKHIIGFQERIPQGKWTLKALGYLVTDIERLTADRRSNPGHTVAWAADVLSRRKEWAEFLGGKGEDRGEALRWQYQNFKGHWWAKVMRDAFVFHEHQGTLSEWERRLREALRNPHR
jgi:hypothetical protein